VKKSVMLKSMEPSICGDLLDTPVEHIPNSAENLLFFFQR